MTEKVLYSSKRSRVAILTFSLILLFAFCGWTLEIPARSQSAANQLKGYVRYLASDELTGRGVDTPGIKLARDFIAREFAKDGLRPGGDNGTYFQAFMVTTGVSVEQPTVLSLDGDKPLTLNQDWNPLGLSSNGKVEAEVVFVGYGITAKEYGYDDYEGIDAKGKIALILRYEPPPKDDKSPFRKGPPYSNYAALRTKAINARDHGAAGMILVDFNQTGDSEKELISTRSSLSASNNSVVAAQLKRRIVERWLEPRGVSLTELKEKIDRDEKPSSMPWPAVKASLSVTLEPVRQRTKNVIAILPGSDPDLKDENIVIGAHYDHLGFGHFGARDPSAEGQIHHGADDNASGTATVLEVAQQMARSNPKPARTIVFVAFSGEELGLLGSRYYVNHPSVPLSATKAMLNLDMVGRLRENKLTVFGSRSAKELSSIVTEEARRLGLDMRESDAVGRSDNMSFYNKKIPALHFFTGSHPDYHRPSDTWDKINADGMAKVTELVLATARRVANRKEPLNFVSLPSRPPVNETGGRRGYGAYLGSIPDLDDSRAGVRLAGVSEGSPAARAGLREGDIIVAFAGNKVQTLEDLAALLRTKRPGDEVDIVVLRTGKPVTLKATLRAHS